MNKKKIPFLSIVTPTYNRENLLSACFQSLLRQTEQDFEWIVVDDGSTDGTEALIRSFAAPFDITYVKKENGGKHTALNASHPYIRGSYVLILDSDDYLTDTAVARIKSAWLGYAENPGIGIVTLLKGSSPEQPFCMGREEHVPTDIMRGGRVSLTSNDCCEVIRASLFRQYPFPVYPGERFLSEGALWNRVSFTHQCVYVNQVVYIANYLAGGLTKSGRLLRIKNPMGGMFTADLNANRKNTFKKRIKNGLLYTCYGFFSALTVGEFMKKSENKGLMCLCLPAGWLLYRYWSIKYIR